jgi:hypothetical protein
MTINPTAKIFAGDSRRDAAIGLDRSIDASDNRIPLPLHKIPAPLT